MARLQRDELADLAGLVTALRYRTVRERQGQPSTIWSFAVIDDLRPPAEPLGE